MTHTKDFSKNTVNKLAKKGITIIGSQAVPAYEGDKYFTGVAYQLSFGGNSYLRTFSQVIEIASYTIK